MITRFKDYKTEQKIIEKTISEIEKFPKKIFIRKTKNYIHNIIVNSSLCLLISATSLMVQVSRVIEFSANYNSIPVNYTYLHILGGYLNGIE